MNGAPVPADALAEAEAAAERAEVAAGIRIVTVTVPDDAHQLVAVLDSIWDRGAHSTIVPPELLIAITYAGGWGAMALHHGEPVGGGVGFIGHDAATGNVHLHSHVVGVVRDAQGTGAGYALKLRQRAWALGQGLGEIRWTFDPLVRRNAVFNLHRLGAVAVEYLHDFFGTMHDSQNLGDESDRLLLRWDLLDERVVRAAAGEPVPAVVPGKHALVCATPPDITAIRRTDPSSARAWRVGLRAALGGAIARGGHVVGLTADGSFVVEGTG